MDRIAALEAFLLDDPDDPFTRFALAQEYRKAGHQDRALEIFEDLVRDHPAYVGTYYHLGALYSEMDQPDNALRIYRVGIAEAMAAGDLHARSELQSALLEAEGLGFDDD
jgi:tetratricopeptide (TPR) repeat protein